MRNIRQVKTVLKGHVCTVLGMGWSIRGQPPSPVVIGVRYMYLGIRGGRRLFGVGGGRHPVIFSTPYLNRLFYGEFSDQKEKGESTAVSQSNQYLLKCHGHSLYHVMPCGDPAIRSDTTGTQSACNMRYAMQLITREVYFISPDLTQCGAVG